MAARTLINVPAKAKRGEVIAIKSLISHIMENGFRHDNTGKPIPRDIITSMVCTYNGEEIFNATLHPAISANPFMVGKKSRPSRDLSAVGEVPLRVLESPGPGLDDAEIHQRDAAQFTTHRDLVA